MYRKIASPEEDLKLKKMVLTPNSDKPSFNWAAGIITPSEISQTITINRGYEIQPFLSEDVAQTIGCAIVDWHLAKDETAQSTIFSAENITLVQGLAQSVSDVLGRKASEVSELELSEQDIYTLIETGLIAQGKHHIAKALVFQESFQKPAIKDEIGVQIIRRNGQVVPWNEAKIAKAIKQSFLSAKTAPGKAAHIAQVVTDKVVELNLTTVEIEEVQDLVQETLMEFNYYKVAESYILYRAERARIRLAQKESTSIETEPITDDVSDQESMVVLTSNTGDTAFWDGSELRQRIAFCSKDLDLCLSNSEIEKELLRSVGNEISEKDLKNTVILNAKSLLEKDADFAFFSGRVLLSYIYEEVLNWKVELGMEGLILAHQQQFKPYLERAIEIGRLHSSILEGYDIELLQSRLDPAADLNFDFLGVQTLYDRYLVVDKTDAKHVRLEVPQFFWMRVAMGIFRDEKPGEKEQYALDLYGLYKERRFCSSTPTLFNSGTLRSQLSSCYLYKVDDSIESIMQRGIAENAYLSKWAGGLGGSWTSVRGTGSHIAGTNGDSQGVIPFLKLHNDQLVAVNQGGKRKGAGCAYLETWHNDIDDFLELRRNTGDERRRCHDMNTANWIPDLFMQRMEARQSWTLFRSNDVSDLHDLYGQAFKQRYEEYEAMVAEGKLWGRKLPAIDLWKRMLVMLFETGHPWITFKDPCNVRSPQDHVGVIHSSNLCTEITLNTSEEETAVCNLGSVILDNHLMADGSLDHTKLKETIKIAIRALDNVIDINFYPTEAARISNTRHRPIGMGVMGVHAALLDKKIDFASQEAVEFNDEFMEAIAYYAYEASSDLAAERGEYSSYQGSKWQRGILPLDSLALLESERGQAIDVPHSHKMNWDSLRAKITKQGMRNSNVLAIAPTATISNIMGTTPCVEPYYKNLYVKSNLSGEFIVLNRHLVKDLKEVNLWNNDMREDLKYFDGELDYIEQIPQEIKNRYKTVFSIDYKYFIEAAARRQKWIDQSQSVNLFLAQPELSTLSKMYRLAWNLGLKTTYYLRTLQASNIEKSTGSQRASTKALPAEAVTEAPQPVAQPAPVVIEQPVPTPVAAAPIAPVQAEQPAQAPEPAPARNLDFTPSVPKLPGTNIEVNPAPTAVPQSTISSPVAETAAEPIKNRDNLPKPNAAMACSLDAMINGGECESCQ